MLIEVEEHARLEVGGFVANHPKPLGETATPDDVLALLRTDAETPFASSDEIRKAVRDVLRWGGYKPTGRGKPASEYLIKAAESDTLGSINLSVDVLNAVSLHSGLPISVVDLDLAHEPFRIAIARDESYIFNASGQEIALDGLLCLFDTEGPCANAVKDSQRTKTRPETQRTLVILWGAKELDGTTARVEAWYRARLEALGVEVQPIEWA